jgi:hypothetical protein
MEKETQLGLKEGLSSIDETVLLVVLVAAISMIDFYSHPHGGLADIERRKMLEQVIGPITNHIGNFGISADMAIGAVFTKNLFNAAFHSEIAQKISKVGLKLSASMIITINALIESFPQNNEAIPDFSMGLLAVALSIPATQLAINKFKKAKSSKQIDVL